MVEGETKTELDKPKNLVILGAGGFAREVAWLVADINKAQPKKWNLIGFWEHGSQHLGQFLNKVPIIGLEEVIRYIPGIYAVAAIGDPKVRERAVNEAKNIGCLFGTLIHQTVQYDHSSVVIGQGSIICPGSILTANITVGAHVIINIDSTIGHDSIIEDYVTISPGCHISGHTTIRRSAFIGSGAISIEKCEIGSNSIIGAGATVVRDIPPNVTAVGIPAKIKE